MTIIMTFFGTLVFIFSCFTVGFKPAVKRLIMFAGIGVMIDLMIIAIAQTVYMVAS